MNGAWPMVGTVAAAAIGFLGTWLVQRNARRTSTTDLTQQIIDQLQETHEHDRAQWWREREALETRQKRTEERVEDGEAVTRLLLDYVSALRHHIESASPPPPPPFPPGLGRHASN